MATNATVVYTVRQTGPFSQAKLLAAMQALDVEFNQPVSGQYAVLAPFGASKVNSVVASAPPLVTLTVVFFLGAQFQASFPVGTDATRQKAPFFNLYTAAISRALSCEVVAGVPALS